MIGMSDLKIGFALSLYDKFDDLDTAIKIIRSWKHDYIISVCCSHPDCKERTADMDIDLLCKPRPILQLGNWASKDYSDKKIAHYAHHIRCAESVRASCKNLENTDVDYVVHTHSDGWFLNEDKLRQLVRNVDAKGMKVATRGGGIEYVFHPFRQCNAFGNVDDHGIVFNRSWCKGRHVWDFNVEDMIYHKRAVHSILATVFGARVGLSNWWYYPYEPVDMYGKSTRSLTPYQYDPMWEFVHVNKETLPYTWGKTLQANVLQEHGYEYMSGYVSPNIYNKIYKRDNKMKIRMKLCGFTDKQIKAYPLKLKKKLVKEMGIRGVLKNYMHTITDAVIDWKFPMPNDAAVWYRKHGYIDELVGEDNWTRTLYDEELID